MDEWRDQLPAGLTRKCDDAILRAAKFLECQFQPNGSWLPLWFGNQHRIDEVNPTYGTSRVLLSTDVLGELSVSDIFNAKASEWLLQSQKPDGGWGSGGDSFASIEETALAAEALANALASSVTTLQNREAVTAAVDHGVAWLIDHTHRGTSFPPTPIGFYFAKLWYWEKLYPLVWTVSALGRAANVLE
jgi:squalene-hopene/tetraprenyl-beta-curcumene cyclase